MKTKTNGFTLIELMIVIAMIAILILMAIAIPAFNNHSNKAPDGSVCKFGMKYNPNDGKQILGSNGGGIPCESAAATPGGNAK